jgi:lipopolysaccharide biosynthesis regulator YciM
MRAPHIVLALLVGAGVAASVAVIPRDRELALMYLKGLDYESAQSALEQRLAAGDMSVGVVIPLTRVYLEIGEFEAAVALMERFAVANPNEAEVKEELAQLYKQSSRMYDYLELLADLARVRPTEKILRELSDHYGNHGAIEKQVEVLRVLVQKFRPRLDDWMDLAQIEADLGNFEAASDALVSLDRNFKVPRTQRTVEFFISILARTGREAEAMQMATSWLDAGTTLPAALGVVRQFIGANKETQALALIDGLQPAIQDQPVMFAERIRLELRLGRRDTAFQRLRTAYAAGTLPSELDDDLIDLALERNLIPMALAIALKGSPMRLPDWQLSSLVGMAPPNQADSVAKWVMAAPEFLERRPVLAASVLKTVGDTARALQMAERALANSADLSSDQSLGLILILADLGRVEPARLHMTALLERFGWEEAIALDLANAMIRLGRAEDGWRRVTVVRDRQRQRASAIDAAWALLSAAAGRADQVVEWLETPLAAQLDAAILAQLAGLAEANGQPKLALAAARRLIAVRDTDDTRLQLASALAALGRHDEVLVEARPLKSNSPEAERLYVFALSTVAKRGNAAAQAELAEFWKQLLAKPGLEPDTLSVLVYILLDKGFGAETMPAIFWLAQRQPETWVFAAAEEAKKAKRQIEARAFFARQLERSDLNAKAREQALFALMDVGGSVEALGEIARLAREDATDQWFYAYVEATKKAGKKADLQQFLSAELKRVDLPKQRREARMYAFLELAGPEASLQELKRFADAYGGDWANVYDEALGKLGRAQERRQFLIARASRPNADPTERKEIAYRLIEMGDRDTAIGIFKTLADRAPPSDPIVGELVYLWRENNQARAAADWLAARAAAAAAAERPLWARQLLDVEEPARALAALGAASPAEPEEAAAIRIEALTALKRTQEAGRIIAARAAVENDIGRLRKLARQGLDADSKVALATVYGKIARQIPNDPEASRWLGLQDFASGRSGLARRHLAQVVETPLADHEVNSAYGEILLQANERDAARFHFRRALEQLEASRDRSVATRVARAQLLNRLGDTNQALALMAALVGERPSDPGLRADYANLLMDNKLYDQARRVLSGQ